VLQGRIAPQRGCSPEPANKVPPGAPIGARAEKFPARAGSQPRGDAASRGSLPAGPKSDPARESLSKFQRLSLALTAVGLAISALGFTAIIISIWIAQSQLSYIAVQTRVQIRDRSLSNVLALHKVFLDHPELRPYFFEGKDLAPSDPLYAQVEAVADMHLDAFAYNLDYRRVFLDDYRRAEDYQRYIRSRLARSPVMRHRLEQNAAWFSPYLQRLDADGAAPNDTVGGGNQH
jgi:hypothetical protein